jgi:hypothetical protein
MTLVAAKYNGPRRQIIPFGNSAGKPATIDNSGEPTSMADLRSKQEALRNETNWVSNETSAWLAKEVTITALSGGLGELASLGKLGAAAKGLTTADFPTIGTKVSQRQLRHVAGRPELAARNGGGYLNSVDDAQAVLNAYQKGAATILGKSPQGFPIVRFDGIIGTNVNVGAGIFNQATNVFIIKGTAKPSIVPTNPFWKPK